MFLTAGESGPSRTSRPWRPGSRSMRGCFFDPSIGGARTRFLTLIWPWRR